MALIFGVQSLFYFTRGTRLFDSKESISVSLTMLCEILPRVGFRMELRVLGTSGEY